MAYDVFISHSSKDKPLADRICQFLEVRGAVCWIAPRDITPGKDWSEAIVEGIAHSKALLLLLSEHANHSIQVRREVQRASERGLHVIPLRLDDLILEPSLEYYLASIHWLDALQGVEESHLEELHQRLHPVLQDKAESAAPSAPTPAAATAREPEPSKAPVIPQSRYNLPYPTTSFVGREAALADIKNLLKTVRLLTLIGSGGSGKTRLSLQAALESLQDFNDGVWLVELAPLSDPNLVLQTLAGVLGVRETPGEPLLQTLGTALAAKNMLLLLDNCEHLLSACAHLAEALLRNCPQVRILASSREGLNIPGEYTYPVPSLSLPDPKKKTTPEKLLQFESVRLFVERAQAVQPGFTVTAENAPALASVCHRLDGIPLAIELAAARVKSLSVEEVNNKLDQRFRLLTGGSRTALPRQQTLRALIDWSYGLLEPEEKILLHRLSSFVGGWTLEAAEAVCAGEPVEDWEVLDHLTSLVDKSLSIAETEGNATRYRMLETMREYGQDKLRETGEATMIRDRHRDWFLRCTLEAEPLLTGPDQRVWMSQLETEHDNLRAALTWCRETSPDDGLRMAGALWRFWSVRGHLTEGRDQLDGALARASADRMPEERAKCLNGAGMLAWNQGDYAAARSFYTRALAINQETGDRSGEAATLNGMGLVARNQGDYAEARRCQEQALAINRELGDREGEATNLVNLGLVAWNQGDFTAAESFLGQALTIHREVGDLVGEAATLNGLGLVARNQGDDIAAKVYQEQALKINREIGNRDGEAANLNALGLVARNREDFAAARTLLEESLEINREIGNRMGEAINLNGLGLVAIDQGEHKTARLRIEQALEINREIGNRVGEGTNLTNLGNIAIAQKDSTAAGTFLRDALKIWAELGQNQAVAESLEAFATLAALQSRPERAVLLYSAANALRTALGSYLSPVQQEKQDRTVAELRKALGEEIYQASRADGSAMPREEAIACALEP